MVVGESLESKVCGACERAKYMPYKRGYMIFDGEPSSDLDIVLSREWFGDVRVAYREILVSNRMTKLILKNRWEGVKFKPIRIVD